MDDVMTIPTAPGSVPLHEVPLERLESEITELAAHLNAAECRWLLLVAEFDRRQGWSTWECRSCAHWLNWKCGIALSAAHEKVRVAHCVARLPVVRASFAAGRLSYSKVRALSRVATPENEESLAELALAGTASHLERIVRAYRKVQRGDEVDEADALHEARFLRWHHDDDGSFLLQARLSPEQGAEVLKALELAREAVDESSAEDWSTGSATAAQRNADALAAMAESFLASGPTSGGARDRHLVTVHVDAEVLAADGEGRCELEEGPALAAETARRLGCDAAVVGIVEDEHGTPLDVGRKTRTISPGLRRALRSRDQGCRFPGCTNTRFVDGHHVQHWAQGGVTSLANLVTLCRAHHRSVHEGGYAIRRTNDGTAPWAFLRPDGAEVPAVPAPPPPTDAAAIPRFNDHMGVDIAPGTMPAWCGERLDLGMAVDGLYFQDHGLAPPW